MITQYDIFGQARIQTDEVARTTRNTYDKNGNLTFVDRAGANDDIYQYDSLGNRIGHINALNDRETWTYDALNRVVNATSFANRATNYTYTWGNSASNATFAAALAPAAGLAAASGWLKRTTDANGNYSDELTDQYGRVRYKRDLGGHTFSYLYNAAGWLKTQTGSTGQNLVYDYYDNGYVKSIRDNATNSYTKYEYDKAGNRTFEGYTSIIDGQGNREFYQYANITYDELNRVKQVWDPKYQINYEYDANSNRRRVLSYYHDGTNGNPTTQDYWYQYDSLNRFTITKGTLVGGRATNATDAARIQKGSTGVEVQYDAASQRKVAIYGSDGHREDYDYNSDGFLTETRIDGVLRATRSNDALGRVYQYVEYNTNGTYRAVDSYTYDKDGKTTQYKDLLTNKGTNSYYLADGTLNYTVSFGDATSITTTYGYEWWDSAKESTIKIQASNSQVQNWQPGYSQFQYDVNGNLKQVNDVAGNRSLRYTTNGEGLILKRDEIANSTVNKTHNWYYANSNKIGDVGNDGQSQEDYAQVLLSEKNVSRKDLYSRFTPRNTADFDQNYLPINNSYPGFVSGNYVVRAGDTLQSIARSMWGDAAMWYLIADANGLTSSSALNPGQNLVIPNKVTNVHNNSSTFKVYNAGEAIGDTSPTLPDAPPPPTPKKKGGCGGANIIVMIVAIVATIFTAGALSMAFGVLMTELSVASVAIAAVAGAVGSIVSQGVGMAMGVQDKFSWKAVGMAALSSAVTQGISPGAIVNNPVSSPGGLPAAIARGVAANVITQGVAVATGLQKKFDWKGVAGAAVSAGVGYGMSLVDFSGLGSMAGFARNAASNFVSRVAVNAVRGEKSNYGQIIAESFASAAGNLIGDSVTETMRESEVRANAATNISLQGTEKMAEFRESLAGGADDSAVSDLATNGAPESRATAVSNRDFSLGYNSDTFPLKSPEQIQKIFG